MASSAAIPDLDRLRPAGTKRSSKRDLIVNAFLKQEGHLSADDLVDLIKREDHRISRATVYRTLQWMVDAGIARKVDFVDTVTGGGFTIKNPNAVSTCGCGSSFNV